MDSTPLMMLLRMPDVIRMTGLGRTTIYKLIKEKQFPNQVKISKRSVAWPASEIQRWIGERPHTK